VTAPGSPGYPGGTRPANWAGLSLPPQLPIVPSAKAQVQVERPQAKPRTNDLEVRPATAILAQRGRPGRGQNWSELQSLKIVEWVQGLSESGPELTREATPANQRRVRGHGQATAGRAVPDTRDLFHAAQAR
jgi:hypothetical protein